MNQLGTLGKTLEGIEPQEFDCRAAFGGQADEVLAIQLKVPGPTLRARVEERR